MPILIGVPHPRARYSTPGLGYKEPLLNGDAGTAQTIALMRKLVDEALEDPAIVRKAIEIVRGVPAFDDVGEVQAIYEWVRRNIRYTKDPVTKEKLYPPAELLKIRAGDCDDISSLINVFATALGYPSRWVTISTQADNPSEFTHVYSEVETPAGSGNWIALDAARLDSQFGEEPPIYYRKRAWDVSSDTYEDLAGNLRKLPKFLSGYVTVPQIPGAVLAGMGQDVSDWMPVIQQTVAETPAIIAATTGKGSASSPYGSYTTPYTPGYGIPAAGYTATGQPIYATTPTTGLTMSPTTLMMIAGAILIFMMARK